MPSPVVGAVKKIQSSTRRKGLGAGDLPAGNDKSTEGEVIV
jgi:hypothetical protein